LDLKCAVIVTSSPHEPLIVTGPNKGGEHNAIIFCPLGLFPFNWYSAPDRLPEYIGPPTTNPAIPVSKLYRVQFPATVSLVDNAANEIFVLNVDPSEHVTGPAPPP
jgi:hypothetical protein